MTEMVLAAAACLLGGAAIGARLMHGRLHPRLLAAKRDAETLRRHLGEAAAASVELADHKDQASRLRHDLRGILSPLLLVADRLAASEDPAARKASDVMLRTVDRATARLAERQADQPGPNSPLA